MEDEENVTETFQLCSGENELFEIEVTGPPGEMEWFGQSLMETFRSHAGLFDKETELEITGQGTLRKFVENHEE